MKLTIVGILSIAFLFNGSSYSKETTQIPIPDVKNEILQLQGLKNTKDIGAFGLILDEIFFWFSENNSVKKYIGDSEQGIIKDKMSNSEITVLLFRDKNGRLKRVVYSNRYLFPLEMRRITIDFKDKYFTSVKMYFMTLSGAIEKSITLRFKKKKAYPLNKEKDFIYWGEANVAQLQREFENIKNKIIGRNFIDLQKRELGTLGKMLGTIFRFSKWMKSENIFIIRHKGIKNVPLQELYADCFFTASNMSLVVLYNSKSEIESVFQAGRIGNEIISRSMVFTTNGLVIRFSKYNLENSQPIQQEGYLIPYTKTEPAVLK